MDLLIVIRELTRKVIGESTSKPYVEAALATNRLPVFAGIGSALS